MAADEYYRANANRPGIKHEIEARFGVTLRTLRRKMKMNNLDPVKLGRPTILTAQEETYIVEHLVAAQRANACMTRQQLMKFAADVLWVRTGIRRKPLSDEWLTGFFGRHPEIAQRTPRTTTTRRENAFTQEASDCFYAKLRALMDGLGPEDVYIMDETHLQVQAPDKVSQPR